jgi:hypothetical protein
MSVAKYPCAGSVSLIAVDTGVSLPSAQFGTQLWMLLVPSPVALDAVQLDHCSAVTMSPPSPEMSIVLGRRPW